MLGEGSRGEKRVAHRLVGRRCHLGRWSGKPVRGQCGCAQGLQGWHTGMMSSTRLYVSGTSAVSQRYFVILLSASEL